MSDKTKRLISEFIRKKTGKRYVSVQMSLIALLINQDNVQYIHDVLAAKQTALMMSNPAPQILEDVVVSADKEIQPTIEKEPATVQLPLFEF